MKLFLHNNLQGLEETNKTKAHKYLIAFFKFKCNLRTNYCKQHCQILFWSRKLWETYFWKEAGCQHSIKQHGADVVTCSDISYTCRTMVMEWFQSVSSSTISNVGMHSSFTLSTSNGCYFMHLCIYGSKWLHCLYCFILLFFSNNKSPPLPTLSCFINIIALTTWLTSLLKIKYLSLSTSILFLHLCQIPSCANINLFDLFVTFVGLIGLHWNWCYCLLISSIV